MAVAETRIPRVAAPLRREVEQFIRSAIADGEFPPGRRLVERELCELMDVSRTSVREALRQLEAEGLVATVPHRGPVVATVTLEEARQIYKVRAVLEGLAGRGFVDNGSPEQLDEIRACLRELEALRDGGRDADLLGIKTRFYAILLAGCGNDVAREMLTLLHNRVTLLRATSLSRPGRLSQTVDELNVIVRALEARDAEAASAACTDHVERAAEVALNMLGDEQHDHARSQGESR